MTLQQIQALVDEGRFLQAVTALDSLPNPSTPQRVLRAYVKSECEGPEAAREAASNLLEFRLTAADKARCLHVLALAAAHSGELRKALRLLDTAVQVVAGDSVLTARAEARLARSLLNWIGVEPALVRLPSFRKAVTEAGDGYSTVAFYQLCAEIEIKRYNRADAERYLSMAGDLLQKFPHLAQEAKLLELRSNHAALCSDYRHALDLAQLCLRKAHEAGWLEEQTVASGNIGYFSLVTGQLRKAADHLRRSTPFGAHGPFAIADLANELELALAESNLELAAQLAHTLQEKSAKLESGYSYSGLNELIARVRWLLRSKRIEEAADTAVAALPFAKRAADRYLFTRLRLLASEAFARAERVEEALSFLSEVLNEPELPLEHLGEVFRVSGVLVAGSSADTADEHFVRAARILECGGLVTAAREVERDRHDTVRFSVGDSAGAAEFDRSHLSSEVIQSLLTIANVSDTPELIGREVLALLRITGLAHAGTLSQRIEGDQPRDVLSFTEEPKTEARTEHQKITTIQIPANRDPSWRLRVAIGPDAHSRFAIVAIQALLRKLHQSSRSSFRQSLLASPVIDQKSTAPPYMIVATEKMAELLEIARRVASSNVTVLLTGETGTGKEVLARALHDASARREMPFIPFNCNAISRDMLDSQLFGYRRGAFTGAHDAFPGVIRAAAGGTLFLDEIGDLSLEVQPKLLRFLESGEIHPLGEPRPITVDVRVVAATNANLEQLVADGKFREDLFYRLNVVRLQVPPLRERREEIPLLVQHFIDRCSRESKKTGIRVAEETMEYLVLYKWPGNVRQLANELRRMVALAESGAVLMPEHLSHDIAASRRTIPVSERRLDPTEFVVRMDQPMSAAVEHLERSMIQYALQSSDGRRDLAAEKLGLSRKGLYLKRQRLQMTDDAADEGATAENDSEAADETPRTTR